MKQSSTTAVSYTHLYYDKETEEVYLRARYYEPGVGRFITRDTYTGESDEPLSLHLYTYCENDGVNAWDPSGHKIKLATKSKKKKKKILTTLYKLTGNKLKIMNKGHYKGYVLFKKAAFSPPLKYPKSMDLVISIMTSNKICKITYDTKKVYYTKCKNIENASNGKGTSCLLYTSRCV